MVLSVLRLISRSPWVAHFNTGACNGCDIEVLATLAPNYDPERFGVKLSPSIRHADILLVTGAITRRAAVRLRRLYEQMAEPCFVVAIGACTISGGVFANAYNVVAAADKVVPVAAYVPGCPPRPEAILRALVKVTSQLRAMGK